MPFHSRYFLSGFKDFVAKEEHEARHLFHENAHEWVGLRLGGEKVEREIQFGGVSRVLIRGLETPENYFQVAVAGILGEAKGIKNQISPECEIDTEDRLARFAKLLFETVQHWPTDPNRDYFIDPDVPMTCPMASTEWGRLTVADLAAPIAFGMAEKRLSDAIVAVAKLFNDDALWGEFLAYNEEHQK